jgi:hypothetical protein
MGSDLSCCLGKRGSSAYSSYKDAPSYTDSSQTAKRGNDTRMGNSTSASGPGYVVGGGESPPSGDARAAAAAAADKRAAALSGRRQGSAKQSDTVVMQQEPPKATTTGTGFQVGGGEVPARGVRPADAALAAAEQRALSQRSGPASSARKQQLLTSLEAEYKRTTGTVPFGLPSYDVDKLEAMLAKMRRS